MSTNGVTDTTQWLSVNEESLFLHDGLLRVSDLVNLPKNINSGSPQNNSDEVVSFDTKNPTELSQRLVSVCERRNNIYAYSRLLEYRLNALKGLWNAHRQITNNVEQLERETLSDEAEAATAGASGGLAPFGLLKKVGQWHGGEPAAFSSRLGLLLLFPLLRSQQKVNPNLSGETAALLINCLRDCPPLSLVKEPTDCLDGLETLLSSWLGETENAVGEQSVLVPNQSVSQQLLASALVAFACARGSIGTFIHTTHLLQQLAPSLGPLPVADVLQRLLRLEGGPGSPSYLQGSRHVVCWGFEDMLGEKSDQSEKSEEKDKEKESSIGRSLACDGTYLYCTNSRGKGLAKIGSGLHGTLRGFVYARNLDLPVGWVACTEQWVLHRPLDADSKPEHFASLVNRNTLKVQGNIAMPDSLAAASQVTISLCSDGTYFYRVWCPPGPDKSGKGQPVTVDLIQLSESGGEIIASPLRPSIILQRNEDALRGVTDPLLIRLRSFRPSNAASLAQLTGVNSNSNGREEISTTSSGLTLKLLRKSPIYCCGSSVVIVTAPPGGSGSSATRSLFSTTTGLSGLRTLATNICFSLSNGLLVSRLELMDAPACAIARGANIQGLGVCYDERNNAIWTCSTDWVDQWQNPGLRATHHVCHQLGVSKPPLTDAMPKDNMLDVAEVVRLLLHHVGSSSCHKVHSDACNSIAATTTVTTTPLGRLLGGPTPPPLPHLVRLCAILEKAVEERNVAIIHCMLVVLQVVFRSHTFNPDSQAERDILERTRKLVWGLLTTTDELLKTESIASAACHVIRSGLSVLFNGMDCINGLLRQLLGEGENHSALGKLRDMILVELACQMRCTTSSRENTAQTFEDSLVQLIMNISVRESQQLLQQCLLSDQPAELVSTNVPMASPCQQFLTALEIHTLEKVIMDSEENEEAGNKPTMAKDMDTEGLVLKLATKVFTGCEEILQTLLSMCNDLFNSDRASRLLVLDRLVKGSVLGSLLPVLVTTLRHPCLRSLSLAEALVPQVVRLVVLISQVAMVLGNTPTQDKKTEKIGQQPHDVVTDLLASHIKDKSEKSPQNYLTNLSIPAPWAAGKTIETIHPVRDNYKFRETVHIPGARCLYLRFETRCATQYDYDKVVIYAGPNTNSRKVAEYGGNTYGYGSRSVLGSGWPKDLVKVEGDTVTFNFEMRSGREHNTPDKALWGFSCTVRAQESSEDCTSGLPFVADLALGLTVLGSSLLRVLYEGPKVSGEEERCQALLSSKLMQRCSWHELLSQSGEKESEASLPRIKLSSEMLQRLRTISSRPATVLRQSIREVINPDALEEAIVSAAIRHLNLEPMLHALSTSETSLAPSHSSHTIFAKTVVEIFNRVHSLERQLQFICDLEQRWEREVDDLRSDKERQSSQAFFIDFHLHENKKRDIDTLLFINDLSADDIILEDAVKLLKNKLVEESQGKQKNESPRACKTRSLVASILERAEILLAVNIAPDGGALSSINRTISQGPEEVASLPWGGVATSPTASSTSLFSRSMSMPADLTTARPTVTDKATNRAFQMRRSRSSAYGSLPEQKLNLSLLLDDLFNFIGTQVQQAVTKDDFLSAVKLRRQRGWSRQQALIHAHQLMTTAGRSEGYAHLVTAITTVLQQGPRIEDLVCGGYIETVQQAFADAMTAIVKLASCHPTDCAYSIGLLCTIPYTRTEEKCLVDSQLVSLLDRLCSLGHTSGQPARPEVQYSGQRVSTLAWAGFQVLANRCVSWETDEVFHNTFGHAGLARQVSLLLTNHLARATESCGNEAAGSEALQEVLSLLNNLSRSRMGRAILSQPACVSKLLSLLLDQRPSPKLVLIILQLCRVALPLMSAQDCSHVQLPAWGAEFAPSSSSSTSSSSMVSEGEDGVATGDPPARIASLLLAKLGDCVVPGCQTMLASEQMGHVSSASLIPNPDDDLEDQDGKLSVFLHKRDEQTSREVIQALLSSEGRPFRLGSGANMEKVLRMDRNMHTTGKAELFSEDAATAIQKAGKLAQAGFVVSVGAPTDTAADSENANKEKQKVTAETVCREKNSDLARTDPVRPFISGHVAHSMASEVIALMHSLLTAPESNTALIWASAVDRVLSHALCQVPLLLSSQGSHMTMLASQPQGPGINQLLSTCRQVVAAFCALGGFQDCVKSGSKAEIVGDGCLPIEAQVLSIAEHQGLASVLISEADTPRIANSADVSVARLQPPKNIVLPLHQLSITEKLVAALHSLLLPPEGKGLCPLLVPLPAVEDGNSQAMATCRVLAEIRSRACAVLSYHMSEPTFANEFVKQTNHPLEVLKSLSQQCGTGERQKVVEVQCEKIRMLYRDCARPPTPPTMQAPSSVQDMTLNPGRPYPPVKACLFSRCMTSLTFLGDPVTSGGLPVGVMCYATQSIPTQATSFYWELEICSYGDAAEDSGPNVSMGLAPPAERKEGANNWTNPVGTVLFPVSGHAIHYSGASLLRWKSVRLDISLKVGDVIGMGWQRNEDPSQASGAPTSGQGVSGHVFMTLNGHKFAPVLEEVSAGLWPVVHVQKKNTQVRANFGNRPFSYIDGHCHHVPMMESSDSIEEIAANFHALPFHSEGESDSDRETSPAETPSPQPPTAAGAPAGINFKLATPQKMKKEYDITESQRYTHPGAYADFTTTGVTPHQTAPPIVQDDSDEEERDGEGQQDHVALLVRAWELKVFPVIRRRFRNEAERRSGLEQIKGALQLGMTDIARQTVEFLYEENGGIPRDLHLPTIDDVKQEAAKFTVDKVRKGTTVLIRPLGDESTGATGGTLVPKYAIRSMLKTLGLSGVVLDVDTQHELVQVESYLRSEGVLVRYWYPLDMLERPQVGMRRGNGSLTGTMSIDISNIQLHRELLQLESSLASLYCRTALTRFLCHCQSPEAIEAIPCSLAVSPMDHSTSATTTSPEASSGGTRPHISHLQLLSNQLLTSSQHSGRLHDPSLLTSSGLGHALAPLVMRSLTAVFYGAEERTQLGKEIAISIATAAQQGERHLLELTNQICGFFQESSSMFDVETIPIGEKINNNFFFKNAVGLVVSCKRDSSSSHRESSLYQAPWARVSCYGMGQRVKKSGSVAPLEVVNYPADATVNTSGGLSAPASHIIDPYPTVILPCNKVHVKAGVSPVPNFVLNLHGLPAQFPLAMAFVESLIGCCQEVGGQSVKGCPDVVLNPPLANAVEREEILKKPFKVTTAVYIRVMELLCGYVSKGDVPALIKEHLFLLMAQVLRLIRKVDEADGASALPITMIPQSVLQELRRFQNELGKLFNEEAMLSVIASGSVPPGQHTSYFQALMELSLAVSEIDQFPLAPHSGQSSISVTVTLPSPGRPTSMVTPKQLVRSSPQVTSRKRRPKMKRAGQQKRTPHNSESDSGEASSNGANNPEDMLWFHRASTLNVIMRYLDCQDPQGEAAMNTAIRDAYQTVTSPSANARLMVISGLPPNMEEPAARRSILKACNQAGGLFMDELWIPVQEEIKPPTAFDSDPKDQVDEKEPPPQSPKEPTAAESTSVVEASPEATSPDQSEMVLDEEKTTETQAGTSVEDSPSEPKHDESVTSDPDKDDSSTKKQFVQGYAVTEVRSKAKVEDIEHALLNSRILEESLPFDSSSVMSVKGEDLLTIATVTPSLLTEPSEMEALVGFLRHKLLTQENSEDLVLSPNTSSSLEDIFKSCLCTAHFKSKAAVESESAHQDPCLSKEQILSLCPGNLLQEFFTSIRPSKLTMDEFVGEVIQKYGVPLPEVKEKKTAPKSGKDGSKGTGKRPSKAVTKERTSPDLAPVKVKTFSSADRKGKSFEKSAEKKSSKLEMSSKEKALLEETVVQKKAVKKGLTLHGFLCLGLDMASEDVCALWRGLLAAGFDIHFERTRHEDANKALASQQTWTKEQDLALVQYINELCLKLAITPARLHPHEVVFSHMDLARQQFSGLADVPVTSIRLRFAFLQSLNSNLEHHFLPLVDLRPSQSFRESTAALLARTRLWLFYDTKVRFFNTLLDATAQRNVDQAAPEVTLDPLQVIGTSGQDKATIFCQAASALASVYSSQLCVKIASGGDPTYAFNVKLIGEEVHGTSGSFRHFLGEVTKELHGDRLRILTPCLSSTMDRHRGRYILRPDPMTFPEERMLIFFGQLLGMALRADIPLALDLLPCFWKCLVLEPLDPDQDLADADFVTHRFLKRIDEAQTEAEFELVCRELEAAHIHHDTDPDPLASQSQPTGESLEPSLAFHYTSMMGDLVELCPNGHSIPVTWSNRREYSSAVRELRMRELVCPERMLAIRCGLASIIPHRLLTIMSPADLELRMCGRPHVDLALLKAHTMYQVGLVETDTHIEFFWQALETFSQAELSRFIKFACNQERIPGTCPCRQGGNDAAHVPPYPMKIAPPDGPGGTPDQRFIRVETCMFMIKLPQYSSLSVMKEKLLYAINCREDPLSG